MSNSQTDQPKAGLRALALRLQREEHNRIVEHKQVQRADDVYQHGLRFPADYSDSFDSCLHPSCVLVREAVRSVPSPPVELHPAYGPCDGMGPRGTCSACVGITDGELNRLRASGDESLGELVLLLQQALAERKAVAPEAAGPVQPETYVDPPWTQERATAYAKIANMPAVCKSIDYGARTLDECVEAAIDRHYKHGLEEGKRLAAGPVPSPQTLNKKFRDAEQEMGFKPHEALDMLADWPKLSLLIEHVRTLVLSDELVAAPRVPGSAPSPNPQLVDRLWLRVKQWREQADADTTAAKAEGRHVFRAALQVSADMHNGFANGLVCDLEAFPLRSDDPTQEPTR